jgi:hypothetical protein
MIFVTPLEWALIRLWISVVVRAVTVLVAWGHWSSEPTDQVVIS